MRFAEAIWLWGIPFAAVVGGLWVLASFRIARSRRLFGSEAQMTALTTGPTALRRTTSALLVTLAVALACVAAARPQYGRGTRVLPATNLDVVLVLDYSKSMYARDVPPSRIERAKIEVARLVQKLGGARMGAIAFAGEPLAFPLTSDGAAIAQFFRGLEPNDMPVGGTAIARALDAGRELFARDPVSERHEKVLVLVTDGEDLEGDPVAVAATLQERKIRVEVVQIGGQSPEPIPDIAEDGSSRGLRKDDQGNLLTTALSAEGEKQLESIATTTGGRYQKAGRGEVGIDEIGDRLRALMTEELSERVETVYADVFHYPLALAVLLLFLEAFVGTSKKLVRPTVPPRGQRAKRVPKRLRASAVLLVLSTLGCEHFDPLFERDSPVVTDAIEALEKDEFDRATELLTAYLETGACEAGVIGAGERARAKGDAAFDLGLAFGAAHDKKSGKSAVDPAAPGGLQGLPFPQPGAPGAAQPNQNQDPNAPTKADASLIECALRLLGPIAENSEHPAALRARALYLMGNLEMRREEFQSAIRAYDRGLLFAPGVPDKDPRDSIGRELAHNRAVALRRAQEKEEREKQEKKDDPNQSKDDEKKDEENQDEKKDPQDPNQSQDPGDQKPEEKPGQDGQKPEDQDGQDQKDAPQASDDSKKPEDRKDANAQDGQEPQDGQSADGSRQQNAQDKPGQPPGAAEAASHPSTSQDERLLDLLEQAPTLQQHDAKRRAGRGRRTMEDK